MSRSRRTNTGQKPSKTHRHFTADEGQLSSPAGQPETLPEPQGISTWIRRIEGLRNLVHVSEALIIEIILVGGTVAFAFSYYASH